MSPTGEAMRDWATAETDSIGVCYRMFIIALSPRPQDHQSVERGDSVVTVDVCRGVPAAACRESECDCGVSGGDVVAMVKVR